MHRLRLSLSNLTRGLLVAVIEGLPMLLLPLPGGVVAIRGAGRGGGGEWGAIVRILRRTLYKEEAPDKEE
jgi:hypothetical protein